MLNSDLLYSPAQRAIYSYCDWARLDRMFAARWCASAGWRRHTAATALSSRAPLISSHCAQQPRTRIFTTSVRRWKDDARARTVQQESEKKAATDGSIKPEAVKTNKAKNDPLLAEQTVSNKEQRKADWAIIKDMAQYLWPKDDFGTRFRVGLSVGLLVGAKVRGLSCFSIGTLVDRACRSSMFKYHSTSSQS